MFATLRVRYVPNLMHSFLYICIISCCVDNNWCAPFSGCRCCPVVRAIGIYI